MTKFAKEAAERAVKTAAQTGPSPTENPGGNQ